MKIQVTTCIDVPDGAQYYNGDLTIDGDAVFYKVSQVGGYDHWWYFSDSKQDWILSGYCRPWFCEPLYKSMILC